MFGGGDSLAIFFARLARVALRFCYHAPYGEPTSTRRAKVSSQEAAVIQRLREYNEVADAWFEWEIEHDKEAAVLVVFVHFDTDPNAHPQKGIARVREKVEDALTNQATAQLSRVRIVPKRAL
jgi:hypothetical protein